MSPKWIIVLASLSALGIIGLMIWYYSQTEVVEVDREVGLQGEAKTNPYLAAERFFEGMGLEVENQPQYLETPPTDHVLFLMANRTHFGARRHQDLLDWVRAGGHLFVRPFGTEPMIHDDSLLEELGFDWFVTDESPVWEDEPDVVTSASEDSRAPYSIQVPEGDATTVGRYSNIALTWDDNQLTPEWWDGEPGWDESTNPIFVHVRLGAGAVTILADPEPFTTRHAGEYDHAELLWNLANLNGPPRGIWFVSQDEAEGIASIVARNFWPGLVGGAVLLVLWLWRGFWRFGPRIAPVSMERRSLEEHLEAAGRLQVTHSDGRALAEATRASLDELLRRRHPSLLSAEDELPAQLADRSGVPEARVRGALSASDRTTPPRELTQRIADLETIRQAL